MHDLQSPYVNDVVSMIPSKLNFVRWKTPTQPISMGICDRATWKIPTSTDSTRTAGPNLMRVPNLAVKSKSWQFGCRLCGVPQYWRHWGTHQLDSACCLALLLEGGVHYRAQGLRHELTSPRVLRRGGWAWCIPTKSWPWF